MQPVIETQNGKELEVPIHFTFEMC
jgi:hypothetical protein